MNSKLCPLCNARKPKRECRFHGELCDSCCGETRNEKCNGCGYYNPPAALSLLPVYKCAMISGCGMHSILVAKESPKDGLIVAMFLVDIFSEGIKEISLGKNKSKLEVDNQLNRETQFGDKMTEISLEQAKKIIRLGAAINGDEWHPSKEWKSAMELIGGIEDVEIDETLKRELDEEDVDEEFKPICPCCGKEAVSRRPATQEEIFEHFMEHNEDSEQYTAFGRDFEKHNKKAKARMIFERQIELYPEDYMGYANLGRHMLKRHNYLKAKQLFLTSLGKLKVEREYDAQMKAWLESVIKKIENMEKEAETCGDCGKTHWKTRLSLAENEQEAGEF